MQCSWSARRARAVVGVGLAATAALGFAQEARTRASAEVQLLVGWVLQRQDHGGRAFAVVDKRLARLHVFDGQGRPLAETAALLGSTWGDHSVPGVGERAQTNSVRADERTTPAGRFEATPGRNLTGEHVVWVDYATAFAIHRVRPGRSQQPRVQRLATATPDDNRVSLGCVIVPVAFYERVVQQVLGRDRSVVYVLPETRPLHEVFDGMARSLGE